MNTRFLHTADLHPRSAGSLAGKLVIDPETGHSLTLTDFRRSLHLMYEVAVKTGCHFAVIPGDVFDTSKPDMDEVGVVKEWLYRLAQVMSVYIIPGNHDMSPNPNEATALETLKYMAHVTIADGPQVIEQRHPEPLQLFTLPYPTKGRLLASHEHAHKSPEEITVLVNEGLRAIVQEFIRQFKPHALHVLLAHGSVANVTLGEQPRSLEHDILLPQDLLDEFDYVALGHIHARQKIGRSAWYCGSLMRGGFGEEKEAKGFHLVDLAFGSPARVEFVMNPHARPYLTLDKLAVLSTELQPWPANGTVVRFKDRLTPEEYDAIQDALRPWRSHPGIYFQEDVEIVTPDRMRDADMAKVMNDEEAVVRALTGKVDDADMPAILEKHRSLVAQEAL
jgi:exonuclease SbcD